MALVGLSEARAFPALTAFARSREAIAASSVRIETGTRFRTVGEDVANVTSAARLTAQTSTLRSALTNGARATSLLQVAREGLDRIRTLLETLETLTTTAGQTGLTPRQFATLDAQFQSAQAGIDAIATTTRYNGALLLDGTASGAGAPVFQLGYPAGSTVTVAIPDITSASLFPAPVAISDSASALAAASSVATALGAIDTAMAGIEASQVQIDTAEAVTRRAVFHITEAAESLIGTDIAADTATRARASLQQQTAAALIAQTIGLNSSLLSLVEG